MRISVVIPVHNRRETVVRAINSVLAQTLAPLEVIVVDDASTDGTSDVVRRQFDDVVVLRNAVNRGVSFSRNRGIEHAAGEWIALLDSDDSWMHDKLERQCEELSRASAPLSHSDEIWIRNGVRVNPRKRHRKRGGYIFEDCLPLCVISPSAVLVRKDMLVELGGFDESLPVCEDYDLWLRICARWPVAYVDRPLVTKYGGHDDQLSRRHWGMDRFRIAALAKLLDDPRVTTTQRRAILNTMIEKLAILCGGARKRGNREALETWDARLTECRRALVALADAR